MKITQDDRTDLTIRHVDGHSITIGDETLTGHVALTADRIIPGWRATPVDALTLDDLAEVLEERPEMLVIGTGGRQRFPPRDLTFALARRGIGLETMDTPAACRTFNILVAEGRRPAALLLLDDR